MMQPERVKRTVNRHAILLGYIAAVVTITLGLLMWEVVRG